MNGFKPVIVWIVTGMILVSTDYREVLACSKFVNQGEVYCPVVNTAGEQYLGGSSAVVGIKAGKLSGRWLFNVHVETLGWPTLRSWLEVRPNRAAALSLPQKPNTDSGGGVQSIHCMRRGVECESVAATKTIATIRDMVVAESLSATSGVEVMALQHLRIGHLPAAGNLAWKSIESKMTATMNQAIAAGSRNPNRLEIVAITD